MLIKQISTKTVFGDKATIQKLVLGDENKSHFLYRVVGEAEAFMTGKGKHQRVDKETGQAVDTFWTKLAGEFMAVNAEGREFEASICFLPEYIIGPIKNAIEGGQTVTFAFDIHAVYSKESATSYEFVAQVVRAGNEESRIKSMMAQMPALPNDGAKKLAHKK